MGELLAEIVEEDLRTVTDRSQRRIVAHRGGRLDPVDTHRGDGLHDGFLVETETEEFLVEILYGIVYFPAAFELL